MAEGLNRCMLIGNLGLDPELKYTQGGQAVLRMRLATTEKWKDKGGDRQERTEWHTLIVWGNRAEALSKILHKGRTIYAEGRLQTRQWEDKDGGKRSTTEIVASDILLLGGGQRGERDDETRSERPARGRDAQQSGNGTGDDAPPDDFDAEGIPF